MNSQALKEKIRKASAELNNLPFNEVWQRLILERFLVRLGRSDVTNQFILKGGSLLARYIDIDRETKDLDFLVTKMKSEKESVKNALQKIASIDLQDGFVFDLKNLNDLAHTHMKYPGFTAQLACLFETMKGQLDIDIGFGDVVDPVEESLELLSAKGAPIFEDSVSLFVYPPETIFAEKLQTALVRGSANSRMKDYHDLLSLIGSHGLIDADKIGQALKATFSNRDTRLEDLPLKFNADQYQELQKYWEAYLRKRKANKLPPKIEEVIGQINGWLSQYL